MLIFDTISRWIDAGVSIKKRDLNADAHYSFGLINNSIIPLQNEYVLRLPKASDLG